MGTFGQRLREEREKRGIPLEEVARAAKVGRHHLEALERNELDRLPGGPFNKGFVRAYARHVGIDPEAAVDAYTREERAQGLKSPDADRELPAPGRAFMELRSDGERPTLVLDWILLRRTLLVAGGLGAAALAAWLALGPARTPGAAAAAESRAPTGASSPSAAVQPTGTDGASGPRPPAVTAGPTTQDLRSDLPPPAAVLAPAPSAAPGSSPAPASSPAPEPASAAARPGSLAVQESGVGASLEGRDLAARVSRFQEGDQAWFWTRSVGGRAGQRLRHVWLREGRVMATYELRVGGPHWRNASRKTLGSGSAGDWTVEARDASGQVLARERFTCQAGAAAVP